MQVEINGIVHEIKFGFKALAEMDKKYNIERMGLKFGIGVQGLYVDLITGNPSTVVDTIKIGTMTASNPPTQTAIENYVMEVAEQDGLEDLNEALIDELKKQPLTRSTIKKTEKATDEAKEKNKGNEEEVIESN